MDMRMIRPNRNGSCLGASSRYCQLFITGRNALYFDLLTAYCVAHCLDMIRAGFADSDFFDDASGFRDDGLLGSLEHSDGRVGPVDVLDVVRIGDGAADDLSMLFVQGHLLFDRS